MTGFFLNSLWVTDICIAGEMAKLGLTNSCLERSQYSPADRIWEGMCCMISSAYRCDNWNQRSSEKKACSSLCFTILGYIKAQLPRNQSNRISPPLWRGNIPWKYLSYATMGRILKDQWSEEANGPVVKPRLCSCKRKVLWFLWKCWVKTLEKHVAAQALRDHC